MKSAYELAMERLEQREGKRAALSDRQKAALADIESKMNAKIAETDIMMQKSITEARARGDAEKLALLENSRRDEVNKLRARAEADKEKVRQGQMGA